MPVTLTTRERASLKARAHALEPVVHVGHGGVTPALLAEVDRALTAHELIKVRAAYAERDERAAFLEAITAGTDAAVVQTVGKVMILWRPRPDATAPQRMTTIEQQ
jgi:RNA-binding protein